jgi:hypothetical protein
MKFQTVLKMECTVLLSKFLGWANILYLSKERVALKSENCLYLIKRDAFSAALNHAHMEKVGKKQLL